MEAINELLFCDYLDTKGIPDPDLMIRTSGEERTSNFLPWQLTYSEFYFTPCMWPDFTTKEFDQAIDAYNQRQRRFGKSEQEEKNVFTRIMTSVIGIPLVILVIVIGNQGKDDA